MWDFNELEKYPEATALKAEICKAAEQHNTERFGHLAWCAEASAEESILADGPLCTPMEKLQDFLGEKRAYKELLAVCGQHGIARSVLAGTEKIYDILDNCLYQMSTKQTVQFLSAMIELLMRYEKQLELDWDALASEMVAFAAAGDTERLYHMAEMAEDHQSYE